MSANGRRRPPRPEIRIVSPAASEDEAAAIAAALERFLAETAPPAGGEQASPWQRAALLEGVSAREGAAAPQGWGLSRPARSG